MNRWLGSCVVLLIAGVCHADIPQPRFRIPDVKLNPLKWFKDEPNPVPLAFADVEIASVGDTQNIQLRIPRDVFNQLKKAAIEPQDDDRNAISIGGGHPIVAGLALSLALISVGIWFANLQRSTPPRLTLKTAIVGSIVFFSFGSFATAQRLQLWPVAAEKRSTLTILVVEPGQPITLWLPKAIASPDVKELK